MTLGFTVDELPDLGDYARPLAARGRDALARPCADVAHREDAGARRGEGRRRPAGAGSGEHESLVVEIDEPGEPFGVRRRAHHDEQRARVDDARRTGPGVTDGYRLKMVTAMQSGHIGAEFDLNPGIRFQPAREIARHRSGQRRPTNEHTHTPD